MNAIETINLRIWYGDNEVIKGVNLVIPEKVCFAIMGPSGCGKSTLLRSFNRLLELNEIARIEGDVKLFGKSVYDMDPVEVRRRVGMVFQIPNPLPALPTLPTGRQAAGRQAPNFKQIQSTKYQ